MIVSSGTQIPSLRPLSTLSALPDTGRQVGIGNHRLPERGIGRGEHDREYRGFRPRDARYQRARRSRSPATIVNGRPIPSNRAGNVYSRRSAWRSTRDASLNSTTTSVDVAKTVILRSLTDSFSQSKPEVTEQQTRGDEHDRCCNRCRCEPTRERGIPTDHGRDDHECPIAHRRRISQVSIQTAIPDYRRGCEDGTPQQTI